MKSGGKKGRVIKRKKNKKRGVEYFEKKKNSGILNVILFVMLNGEFFELRFTLMNFLICPNFF